MLRLERLFKLYYTPLGMYALRLTGNIDDAQDTVQAVFCAFAENVRTGIFPSDAKAYLYRAVHNRAITLLRQRGISTGLEEIQDVSAEAIDTAERDALLWQAVDALPPKCREIFLAAKRDSLSIDEIAAEMAISAKTVKNQLTKAYATLRKALKNL